VERCARSRARRSGKTVGGARGLLLAVPFSLLLIVCSVVVTASPSGSVTATPQIATSYSLSLHDISANQYSNGALTGVKLSQGKLSGQMVIVPPLHGSGPFLGTVSGNNVKILVVSTVPNPCGCEYGSFVGTLGKKGEISGTYVGVTKSGSETGTWQAIPHRDFNCSFRARVNHKYVTAQVKFTGSLAGVLRAQASTIGPAEKFVCHAIGVNLYAIKSRANGKYATAAVKAKGALQGVLRAQASSISARERYTLISVPSCKCFALQAANSKYVTVETGDTGSAHAILQARAAKIAVAQEFDVAFG
jgi:hypothetical protein